jgi:hypothetical protein
MTGNILNRPMFVQNYQQGGPAMPVPPQAQNSVQANDQVPQMTSMDNQITQGIMNALEGLETFEDVMNLIRGNEQTEDERREELAEVVGEEDAQVTPESVLTIAQIGMQEITMANEALDQGEQRQGITGLPEGEAALDMEQGALIGGEQIPQVPEMVSPGMAYGGMIPKYAHGGIVSTLPHFRLGGENTLYDPNWYMRKDTPLSILDVPRYGQDNIQVAGGRDLKNILKIKPGQTDAIIKSNVPDVKGVKLKDVDLQKDLKFDELFKETTETAAKKSEIANLETQLKALQNKKKKTRVDHRNITTLKNKIKSIKKPAKVWEQMTPLDISDKAVLADVPTAVKKLFSKKFYTAPSGETVLQEGLTRPESHLLRNAGFVIGGGGAVGGTLYLLSDYRKTIKEKKVEEKVTGLDITEEELKSVNLSKTPTGKKETNSAISSNQIPDEDLEAILKNIAEPAFVQNLLKPDVNARSFNLSMILIDRGFELMNKPRSGNILQDISEVGGKGVKDVMALALNEQKQIRDMHKALIAAGITRETEFGKARIAATPKAFSIMKQALQLSQAGHPDLARMLIEVHKIERGKGQEEVLGGIVEKLITAGIVDETFLADTEKMKGLKEKIRNAVPDVFEELYKRKETPAGLSLTTDKLNKITQTLIKNNFSQASIDNLTKTLTDANYNVDVNKIVEFAKSKAKTLNLGTE